VKTEPEIAVASAVKAFARMRYYMNKNPRRIPDKKAVIIITYCKLKIDDS